MEKEPYSAGLSSKTVRVFLVDDSLDICQSLKRMLLRIRNVEVCGESHSAHEALRSIHRNRPDVVILDLKLPDGSGVDVLKTVKTFRPVPMVVIFTSFPSSHNQERCRAAGADFFFDKSTQFLQLEDVFQKLVESL